LNLFNGGKRYYLLVCNSISEKAFDATVKDKQAEEGLRMFFLLDANLKVICQHRAEQQQASSNVTSVCANENFTKILVNCQDRVMRLY